MKSLQIASEILINVLDHDIPFALALRNTFKKNNVDHTARSNITALVGCELRHHLLFEELVKDRFGEVSHPHCSYVLLLLADTLFLKRFVKEEILSLAIAQFEESSLDIEALKSFADWIGSTNELIPSQYPNGSIEYLSLRFNTPLWIVKMWQKQYGRGLTIKILKTNYKAATTTVRLNSLIVSKDEILSNQDFVETMIEDIFAYRGKAPIKKQKYFENNGLFYEKMATKYLIDKLELDPLKKVAVYGNVPNNIYLDLSVRFKREIEVEVMTAHSQVYYETKRNLDTYHLDKVKVYDIHEGGPSLIVTCLSNKVNTMFVLPKNSMFDLLRSTPDYFLRIKQSSLDELIAGQNLALVEAAKFVEDGGTLVYMVPTINKKEGEGVIKNFLLNNHDFSLLDEKQFFPFEAMDSCLYYAIMHKKEVKDE